MGSRLGCRGACHFLEAKLYVTKDSYHNQPCRSTLNTPSEDNSDKLERPPIDRTKSTGTTEDASVWFTVPCWSILPLLDSLAIASSHICVVGPSSILQSSVICVGDHATTAAPSNVNSDEPGGSSRPWRTEADSSA